ncbi:hypothetical protein CL97_gp133 [Cronobacter phage CR9]|uniref:Uncharacterized protein n=1 Tax=Cronobacter phage CR9 TaxID=1162290 RepID=M1F1B0_9CAUD|nr:hypothetical protein CL97_gp133 [Cronobacter phage CR9]AFH21017.1 hypothetical protein CR9_133 [Cronobacter phage CR9]
MAKLTKPQQKFLLAALRGEHTRDLKGKVQDNLSALGLIRYLPPFGWVLTSEGGQVARELEVRRAD